MATYSGSSSPTVSSTTPAVASAATPRNTRTSHFGSGSRNHLKATATAAKTTASPAQAPIRTWITVAPPGATVIADSATKARTKRAQRYQEILVMLMAVPCVDILLNA